MKEDGFWIGVGLFVYTLLVFIFGMSVGSGNASTYVQCVEDVRAFGGESVVKKWDGEHRK